MTYYIYGHYKPDSDIPFYIGKGKGPRAYSKHGHSKYWNRIVKKYGYRVEMMYADLSEELAFELERQFVKKYGRMDLSCGPLVNHTDGGEGPSGYHHTKETKIHLSTKLKGVKQGARGTLSAEHKAKISPLGRVVSESTKEKIRLARTGTKRSDATCQKISEVKRSKNKRGYTRPPRSQEWKDRISAGKRKGPYSPEERERLYASRRKLK